MELRATGLFFVPVSSLAVSNVCQIAQMGHKCAKQEKMALIGEKRARTASCSGNVFRFETVFK